MSVKTAEVTLSVHPSCMNTPRYGIYVRRREGGRYEFYLPAMSMVSGICPWVVNGSARWWPVELPGVSGCQWPHPFASGCLGEADRVAGGGHGRNAKLILEVTLRVDASSAGIYSRVEVRRRALRRPPVSPDVSSNNDRSVQ